MEEHDTPTERAEYHDRVIRGGTPVAAVDATELSDGGAEFVKRVESAVEGAYRYPSPSAMATRTDPEPASTGVRTDTLMDAAGDAHAAQARLSEIYVDLDHMADDLGLFPGEVNADMRFIQQHVQAMAEWIEAYRDELQKRRKVVEGDG